jgi:PAS domain S-box-containing protein
MTAKIPSNHVFEALRRQAERALREQGRQPSQPPEEELDLMRLAHELEVQYVELELQNEELRRMTMELEASRDEFAELYQSAPVAFVTLDRNGVIQQVNTAAALMLKDPQDFLAGSLFLLRIHPEDRRNFHARLRKQSLEQNGDTPIDVRLLGGNGQRIVHAQVHVAMKHNGTGGLCWRLALVDVTARRQYEDALENARRELEARVAERTAELEHRTRQLARLTSALTLAEQRERRRLAERLHDHLQQMLAGARLNLEMLGGEHELREAQGFKDAYQLVMEAITTARSLSAELSPPVLYLQGLSGALEWLARWMRRTHKLEVAVTADPAADPAREDLKVLLLQSVRELLFNVSKHADINAARVEMAHGDGHTRIVVSDRGKGFDAPAFWQRRPAVEGGFGLFSIRERLTLLGGRFDIVSTPGQGTTATLSLPLQTLAQTGPPPSEAAAVRPLPPDDAIAEVSPRNGDKIRILLVDDHAMVRKGLSMLLAGHSDIEIAGEAEDGRQAIELACQIRPDVILMDINMPVMNGLEATHRIHAQLPGTRIIGLSMHAAEDQAKAMREAGAVDYLNKSGSPSVLLRTIRKNAGQKI